MNLIVRADDFGLSEGATLGVLKAFNQGIVTSTSVIVNQEYSKTACKFLKDIDICTGLHLNLVLGRPIILDDESYLVENGQFKSSQFYRNQINSDPLIGYEKDLEKEVLAQIEEFVNLVGRMPDYIDIHALVSKTLDQVISNISQELNIKFFGYYSGVSQNVSVTPKRLPSIYDFYKKNIEPESIAKYIFEDVSDIEVSMIVIHPAFIDIFIARNSSMIDSRFKDLKFATCDETKRYIKDHDIRLISHHDL